MTNKGKEVKMGVGYSGQPKPAGKEFNVDELYMLQQVFGQIEKHNPKRNGAVDYWISTNRDALGKAWNQFKTDEKDIYLDTAKIYEHPTLKDANGEPEKFFYLTGDPASEDVVLLNDFGFYKLVEGEEVVLEPLQKQTWTHVTPAGEGDEQDIKVEVPYNYQFLSDEKKAEFEERFEKLKSNTYPVEFKRLQESHLENINVMWVDVDNSTGKPVVTRDLTPFRNLLYDNAVIS